MDEAGTADHEDLPDRNEEIARHGAAMQEFMARAVLFQDAVAHAAGLNSTDLQTIGILISNGPLTAGELAARVGLTKGGAITAVIDRLERSGYVKRDRDLEDRRRVAISAVPDALMPRIGPIYARISEIWGEYLDTLTTDQIRFATDMLQRAAELNSTETIRLRASQP